MSLLVSVPGRIGPDTARHQLQVRQERHIGTVHSFVQYATSVVPDRFVAVVVTVEFAVQPDMNAHAAPVLGQHKGRHKGGELCAVAERRVQLMPPGPALLFHRVAVDKPVGVVPADTDLRFVAGD